MSSFFMGVNLPLATTKEKTSSYNIFRTQCNSLIIPGVVSGFLLRQLTSTGYIPA